MSSRVEMVRLPEMVRQFVDRRWVLRSLATIIALVSLFFFVLTLRVAYFDYWFEPKEKAADYIYPQLRYTVFDSVLTLWCVVGMVASVLSFRSGMSSESASEWTHRTLAAYFILFAVLILGGTLMLVVRSQGY